MSTFAELAQNASSTKIILCEIDIGRDQLFWTNWRAGSWFVNIDADYPNVASLFLTGVEGFTITFIGSVTVDGVILAEMTSETEVQTTESSFYYDSSTNDLYIHIEEHDEPSMHLITIGIAYGLSNYAGELNNYGVYNGYYYDWLPSNT